MCIVYETLVDTLRMNFVVTFLELWLRMLSLELWLGIEGKHVAFLELWFEMTSLELWLRMVNEHEHSSICGSDWRVLPVWVCKLWLVWMGPERLPSSALADEFGSIRTNTNYGSYWENEGLCHHVNRSTVCYKMLSHEWMLLTPFAWIDFQLHI